MLRVARQGLRRLVTEAQAKATSSAAQIRRISHTSERANRRVSRVMQPNAHTGSKGAVDIGQAPGGDANGRRAGRRAPLRAPSGGRAKIAKKNNQSRRARFIALSTAAGRATAHLGWLWATGWSRVLGGSKIDRLGQVTSVITQLGRPIHGLGGGLFVGEKGGAEDRYQGLVSVLRITPADRQPGSPHLDNPAKGVGGPQGARTAPGRGLPTALGVWGVGEHPVGRRRNGVGRELAPLSVGPLEAPGERWKGVGSIGVTRSPPSPAFPGALNAARTESARSCRH